MSPDNREAWLAVITDLTAEVQALREENASQRAALEARAEDTARLSWLEARDRESRGALRKAIDAAMAESGT